MTIQLDFTNCLSEAIGATHGLTKSEVETLVAKFPKHHESIEEMRANGESAFFDLPYQDLGELKALAKKHQGKWSDLVVVATGGSALAARTLLGALGHAAYNLLEPKARKGAPRIHILDNADPIAAGQLLEALDLKKTLFQVVSRSGLSAETDALLMWVVDVLRRKVGKAAPAAQIVAVTDREKGPLAEICKQEKIEILHNPANLAGRFALLGAAGLFSATLAGFDAAALLAGAGEMDKRCRHGDPYKNPAYMHSLTHYLLTRKRRKTMHVTFSFSNRIHAVGLWYDHLCSVSLGKMLNRKGKAVHVGPSPVAALGAFDLHGQQQLFAEGPFDKVVTFIVARSHGAGVAVPQPFAKAEALGWLKDRTFEGLLDAAYVGCEHQLTAAGRPNMTLTLDAVDEAHIGGLIYLLELSIAMSAELYGIDPFDAPGVEQGKQAIYAQCGRAGFEDLAKRIKDHRAKPRRTC
jgi:glucose-6-phosphate isomerase